MHALYIGAKLSKCHGPGDVNDRKICEGLSRRVQLDKLANVVQFCCLGLDRWSVHWSKVVLKLAKKAKSTYLNASTCEFAGKKVGKVDSHTQESPFCKFCAATLSPRTMSK